LEESGEMTEEKWRERHDWVEAKYEDVGDDEVWERWWKVTKEER
jgi:hypothetical protein